jgi:hypothetical protein
VGELNDEERWSTIDNILKRAKKAAYSLEIVTNEAVWLTQFSPRLQKMLSALRPFELEELYHRDDESFSSTISSMLLKGRKTKTQLSAEEAERIAIKYVRDKWNAKVTTIHSNVVTEIEHGGIEERVRKVE